MCGLLLLLTQESKAVDKVDVTLAQVYGAFGTACTKMQMQTQRSITD